MNKKEKAWFVAAVLSFIIGVFYFTFVMIWAFGEKPVEVEQQDFPPIEIVDEISIIDEAKQSAHKKELGIFELTAYCSCEKCCGEWAQNRPVDDMGNEIVFGAYGVRLIPNVSVAVDPSVIPYGAELEIDGKTYIAHDCGGAIRGNRIDVYFENHQDARNFGVQTKMVYMGGDVS